MGSPTIRIARNPRRRVEAIERSGKLESRGTVVVVTVPGISYVAAVATAGLSKSRYVTSSLNLFIQPASRSSVLSRFREFPVVSGSLNL